MRRGYPINILDESFNVKALDRLNLISSQDNTPTDSSTSVAGDTEKAVEKLFSITAYNPVGNPNQQLIKSNWSNWGLATSLYTFTTLK